MSYEDQTPLEIKTAVEDLVRLAHKHKVAVAGFAFGAEPPFMMNFGSCSDMGDIALYTELCSMAEDKRRRGMSINVNPGMVQ